MRTASRLYASETDYSFLRKLYRNGVIALDQSIIDRACPTIDARLGCRGDAQLIAEAHRLARMDNGPDTKKRSLFVDGRRTSPLAPPLKGEGNSHSL
jgi:hypothetical protein